MTSHGLCAPNTTIVDFAYDNSHPLRLGNFPTSKHSSVASESDFYDDPQYESYSSDEINSRAVALFDFTPENDNEVPLKEGQEIWVSYRHGQGWLVAEDPETGENGLVPEEYVEIIVSEEPDEEPQRFVPFIFQGIVPEEEPRSDKKGTKKRTSGENGDHTEDDEWEDTEDEVEQQRKENELNSGAPEAGNGNLDSLETSMEHMHVK